MALTEILGYFGALIIGIVLGLIGGGGSILTVPLLVYLLYVEPVKATAYSLFVVGFVSLVGTLRNIQKDNVSFKTVLTFTLPAVVSIFSTRKFLIPAIPENIIRFGGFTLTKDIAVVVFFALLMLTASITMIRDSKGLHFKATDENRSSNEIFAVAIFGGF